MPSNTSLSFLDRPRVQCAIRKGSFHLLVKLNEYVCSVSRGTGAFRDTGYIYCTTVPTCSHKKHFPIICLRDTKKTSLNIFFIERLALLVPRMVPSTRARKTSMSMTTMRILPCVLSEYAMIKRVASARRGTLGMGKPAMI